ncbi:MAG: prephenate dehydrogenase [Thermotaleaceae bacterium]
MDFFKKITIIGMGLIGGSLASGLKNRGYDGEITGYDVSKESLTEAKELGIIDKKAYSLKEAVEDVDLVILSTPIAVYEQILKEIGPWLKEETILTDMGSVKSCVGSLIQTHIPDSIQFIGGHPMAGSEKGGLRASSPTLYENAYYFLTPLENTTKRTIDKMEGFVSLLGAYPVIVSSEEHDKIVATISHIPHLAAVLLANMVDYNGGIHSIPFVGGGFRDTTRIASGNPKMWKDIFFYNKSQLVAGMKGLEEMLGEFRELIERNEEERILELLNKAKFIRDSIPKRVPDYLPPLYEVIIDVEDKPGALGELTRIMGDNDMNIKEIEILHAREGEQGAIRIGFASLEEQKQAADLLRGRGFFKTYLKGERV